MSDHLPSGSTGDEEPVHVSLCVHGLYGWPLLAALTVLTVIVLAVAAAVS
jgi:hypothetical protein